MKIIVWCNGHKKSANDRKEASKTAKQMICKYHANAGIWVDGVLKRRVLVNE